VSFLAKCGATLTVILAVMVGLGPSYPVSTHEESAGAALGEAGVMEQVAQQLEAKGPDPVQLPPEGGASQAVREWTAQVVGYVTWLTAVNYITAISEEQQREAEAAAEMARVQAEQQARERAAMAAQPGISSSQVTSSSVVPTSSGSCGGATNGADQYIGRESGGNPGVFNTEGSGAYGCYQIMPATWASSCSDLGPEVGSSPAAQAACASRLPLSAWGG
jgi:hypothetical protein